ncbi:MAG: hypothetical protein IT262_14880 [Saprospiraceae bacterium]|nr:hypothetical protein [Saprospiraceae bacterium]
MDNRTETLLELYYANELSETDAVELRHLLDNDPEAAAEWKWQQQIATATRQMKLEAPAAAPKQPLRILIWSSLAAAAALAAWAVATIFMPQQPTVQEAIASSFEHYPNRMSFKALDPTAAAEVPADVIRAFQLYDDPAQYRAAAEALGTIASKYPDHPEYGFYHGVALLGTQNYLAAADALQKTTLSDGPYRVPALYFLGLAQSGAGRYPEARQSFESYLKDKDGIPYRKKAGEMLKVLAEK